MVEGCEENSHARQLKTTARVLRRHLFISCVFAFLGQSTRPMLADDAIVSRAISHSPMNAISSPSGSIARTKRITQVVILWVATARKIPNAVQGSVGRVSTTPIATIREPEKP